MIHQGYRTALRCDLGRGHPRRRGEHYVDEVTLCPQIGSPSPRRRTHRPSRSSPSASAESTRPRAACPCSRTEHPRVGGEHVTSIVGMLPKDGTPPRRRGAQELHGLGDLFRRRHPRVGGEHSASAGTSCPAAGTPPRRRGALRVGVSTPGRKRNTPASAGSTVRLTCIDRASAEHPRFGGEHGGRCREGIPAPGTPPRRRGARCLHGPVRHEGRNTPASAGSTRPGPHSGRIRAEHPRVGGEHTGSGCCAGSSSGTPPRRRGARV